MKKLLILSLSIFAIGLGGFAATVKADDVEHYEGKEFKNKKEAFKTLKETSAEMAKIVAEEKLDVAKMEQVHQISYTTEDAIALIDKKDKADLSDLAAKLEEVHLASEGHQADDLRRDFITYQAELVNYITSK